MLVDERSAQVDTARSLWSAGRRTDALALFAEAIRRNPDNVHAYVMAARAHAEQFDFERMEETHERLLERAPRHPGVHHYLAETFAWLKLPERAMARYEYAARLPGGGPPTWMELAALYERAHRLDEAEELIERVLRADFDLPQVWLVRARLHRRRNRLDQAEATLRGMIARCPVASEWTCQAFGELALLKDRQGDYDGAIRAIEGCKRAQRAQEHAFLAVSAKVQASLRETIRALTREDLLRWQNEARALEPRRTALLTGFPRSGTTLLEQVLDAHPDLVSSAERDFIGRELMYCVTAQRGDAPLLESLRSLPPGALASQRDRYFRGMEYLLGAPIAGRMHLDKNPAHNMTIPLLLRFFPDTRLILALRDPRDVVLSCYLRYLPLNSVSVHYLDVQRAAERYALDMGAWLELRERIPVPWCEVRYEDTVADLRVQAARALETLGLPWDEKVLAYRDRLTREKQVNSPSYEAVAEPIYTHAVGRWRSYARILEPALSILEPFVREFGYEA